MGGGFLKNIDHFDPGFFSISPREAELMDPQHRLLIETCWKAMESACLDAESLKGKSVGLFVGIGSNDYINLLFKSDQDDTINPYYATGNALSMAAGHISYLFGWEGPSMSIDTSCSSSLVAIHYASKSLRAGESKIAFVGGVNLTLLPQLSISLSRAQMLSKDGRCKTFDADANGYVRSEGCGVVVLKRLEDALKDGNRVLAVIKGSAVNQDGASNGLTAPNGLAQEKLYHQALKESRLSGADIDYIEAHGTGTKLGDPIEMNSIAAVYGKGRTSENPLIIGSVKSNIGHMEAAAGMGSFIKAVLSLYYEKIPSNIHFKNLNPLIDLSSCQGVIPIECIPWKRGNKTRRVGVSSFGFSGTNGHAILEEAPYQEKPITEQADPPYHLVVLSAKTEKALHTKIHQLKEHIKKHNIQTIGNISYTLTCGRTHFEKRAAFIVKDVNDLLSQLEEQTPLAPINDPLRNLYEKLKDIYLGGQSVDWVQHYKSYSCEFIDLPSYPFQHKSYWAEPLQSFFQNTSLEERETYNLSYKGDAKDKVIIPLERFAKERFQEWLVLEISQLLKIPVSELSLSENLYQYGIDSLTAMEIESRIEKKYGYHVPATVFMQTPTINALSDYIAKRIYHVNNQQDTPNLIFLNKSDSARAPLFLIHPASGNTLCYAGLSKLLGESRPIYAIEQSPLSFGKNEETITKLAQKYLTQIRHLQPEGPYALLGWSLGGVIAHEMAYLLEQERQQISYLGMFDSYVTIQNSTGTALANADKLKRYFIEEFCHIFQVPFEITEEEIQSIKNESYIDQIIKLCSTSHFFNSNSDLASMRQLLIHCFLNMDILATHIPHKIKTDIHFFVAQEKTPYADSISFSIQNQTLQWMNTTTGVLHPYELPANHYSILYEPHVSNLADYIIAKAL